MANSIQRSEDGHRNFRGILRYVPSAEGGRGRHVRLDEELRRKYLASEPTTTLSHTRFSFQPTLDDVEMMKGIEQRVQSLSGVITSPVHEDDYAEKGRRVELRRSVLI